MDKRGHIQRRRSRIVKGRITVFKKECGWIGKLVPGMRGHAGVGMGSCLSLRVFRGQDWKERRNRKQVNIMSLSLSFLGKCLVDDERF